MLQKKLDSIRNIIKETFSEYETLKNVKESDVELRVDQLAGSLVAAGPQKVADAISKMSPDEFKNLAVEINKKGIGLITAKFVDSIAPNSNEVVDSPSQDGNEQPPQNQESPESLLKDL